MASIADGESWSASLQAMGRDVVKDWTVGPFTSGGPFEVSLPIEVYTESDGLAITVVLTRSETTTGRTLEHAMAPQLVVHSYGTDAEAWSTLDEVVAAAAAASRGAAEDDGLVDELDARVTTAVLE